ncbi:glycoside hydrolase family 26 protein [Plenodomus tracheiphilus IPT5]|uniref:Glycoside hydrolase family 26 protein n=1 Tax=Plenodomus tracheiphilus IPT5 TaxID=1408161 RepID=A0A6A7B4G1_9PLEO|nr:glycoside hydrolase family 26 protein [Plenodomus tracheiphilus IPT5]
MFRLGVAVAALIGLTTAQSVTYQAEDATLSGVTVGTSVAGFLGSGYVENFSDATDKITFNVNANTSALYDLSIIYNGPNGDKYTSVVLNNNGGSQISLPATTLWTTVSAGQVLLNTGSNTIEIQSNWGWYLIDAITLSPSAPRPPHKITTTPVNPNANADAKALLSYLGSIYGKHILSGQQDQASLDWVTQNIGHTPAILGVDFMDYTDSRTSRGASSLDVEHALTFAEKGGIVTFVWHWGAPVGLYDNDTQPWWSGFYTAATDFSISDALSDTTNANYTLLMHDIDTIAVQLKKLQDAGVPVLFRPLHEAEGGWFWWGAEGPEPCKKLWRILYNRLTETHNLNNLIWVWNSVSPAWYPGSDVVDIVSADTYSQGDHGPISATYNSLLALTDDTKIVAAAEVGSVMEVEGLKAYGADWSWFVVWTGEYISGGEWNSKELLTRVYGDEYVLTLEEIQGWRGGTV